MTDQRPTVDPGVDPVAVIEALRADKRVATSAVATRIEAFMPAGAVVHVALRVAGLDQHVERVVSNQTQCRIYVGDAAADEGVCEQIAAVLRPLWLDGDQRVQVFANEGTDLRYVTVERRQWSRNPPQYRTPAHWCAHHQVRIVDWDGWRGAPGLPPRGAEELISDAEFQARFMLCTAEGAIDPAVRTGAWIDQEVRYLTSSADHAYVLRLHTERVRDVVRGRAELTEVLLARGLLSQTGKADDPVELTEFGRRVAHALWFTRQQHELTIDTTVGKTDAEQEPPPPAHGQASMPHVVAVQAEVVWSDGTTTQARLFPAGDDPRGRWEFSQEELPGGDSRGSAFQDMLLTWGGAVAEHNRGNT